VFLDTGAGKGGHLSLMDIEPFYVRKKPLFEKSGAKTFFKTELVLLRQHQPKITKFLLLFVHKK